MYFNLTPKEKNTLHKLEKKEDFHGATYIYCNSVQCNTCPINCFVIELHKNKLLQRYLKPKETTCAAIYRLMMEQIEFENKIKEVIKDGKQHL